MKPQSILVACALVVASGVSCSGEAEHQQPTIAGERIAAGMGMNVEDLRSVRPTAHFAPYAGWVDSLPQSELFASAHYEFYRGQVETSPPEEGGRLWAVRLTGRNLKGESIVNRLKSEFGTPEVLGCISALVGSEFEVYQWFSGDNAIVAAVPRVDASESTPRVLVAVGSRTESASDLLNFPTSPRPCS